MATPSCHCSLILIQFPVFGDFTIPLVLFHRPLSSYFKAFKAAGFEVEDMDEPSLDMGADGGVPPEKIADARYTAYKLHNVHTH